jgi:tetratricopeptide (TPR) repeat protein
MQFAQTAIGEFEKVLEVEPGNLTALGYIASLYYGLSGSEQTDQGVREFFDKAKEFRRRLIEVDPQNPVHYYSIGVIDWALAFKANMAKRAELGLSAELPLPPRSLRQLADENSALVEEGSEMLEKAIEINPTYIDAISYLNLMYRQKADIVATSQEREEWLQRADEQFARQERLRKTQEADANGGN